LAVSHGRIYFLEHFILEVNENCKIFAFSLIEFLNKSKIQFLKRKLNKVLDASLYLSMFELRGAIRSTTKIH
jgi:hypothetical protein